MVKRYAEADGINIIIERLRHKKNAVPRGKAPRFCNDLMNIRCRERGRGGQDVYRT